VIKADVSLITSEKKKKKTFYGEKEWKSTNVFQVPSSLCYMLQNPLLRS